MMSMAFSLMLLRAIMSTVVRAMRRHGGSAEFRACGTSGWHSVGPVHYVHVSGAVDVADGGIRRELRSVRPIDRCR